MTLQAIPGAPLISLPRRLTLNAAPSLSSATSISASGHQYGISGTFMHKDGPGASKNITSIGFNAGAIVSAGGTTLKTGLQGVATGTTGVQRPNGTYINSGNAFGTSLLSALTGSAWNSISITSSALTVGTKTGVMFEFTGYGGADSLVLRGLAAAVTSESEGMIARNPATSFANTQIYGSLVLGCDDGTYGTITGCWACESVNSANFSTSGTECNGIVLNYPFAYRVYGAWALLNMAASGSAGNIVLATTPIAGASNQLTYGFDVAGMRGSNFGIKDFWFTSTYDVAANTEVSVFVDSNTANNVGMYYLTVNTAAHLGALGGYNASPSYFSRYTRAGSSGGFTVANSGLDFPIMGLYVGALSDDAATSSGGGGLRIAGCGGLAA